MSKEQFELKRPEIEAIAEPVIPTMPVSVAIQEGEDLAKWCALDRAMLEQAGVDPYLIDDLHARIEACRYAQSEWKEANKSSEEEWKAKAPAAYEMRDEMLHHFLYAYRKYPDLLRKVQQIAEGSSHADMVQDLSDLAVLGTKNPQPLRVINYELNQLVLATATSSTLADVLATLNGTRISDDAKKTMRDKAYTFMKQAIDEIRDAGQYLFYRNEDRKKGYVSRYMQYKANQQKKAEKAEPLK